MKRIVLFLLTNLAVMIVISIMVRLFGLDQALDAHGLNLGALLAFSAVVGFTGAIISLLMSKSMAKWSTGAQVINAPRDENQAWLLDTVKRLADKAGIRMPQVAVYEGAPNAFATGAFRNAALVAVSSGLLSSMSREELEAVLGHEIAHVANGDMVTNCGAWLLGLPFPTSDSLPESCHSRARVLAVLASDITWNDIREYRRRRFVPLH